MVSLNILKIFLSIICFFLLDQITKIKICHIFASENPEVIEGSWWLIATDVIDYEEAYEDDSIDNYGASLDE